MHADILWQLGPVSVYTLGMSLALGFLTATMVAIPHLRRRGIRRLQVLRLMLAVMLFSVLGARIAAVLFWPNSDEIVGASLFLIPPDGLAYYGGVITTIAVIVIFCAQQRWPLLPITDALVPAAALGLTVGISVPLGTNLLHLQGSGPPWLNLLLFTVAYGGAYLLWKRSERSRFPGELTLLLLGGDSLLRLIFGAIWTYGYGESGSVRMPLLMLAVIAALWFSFRGAAQRRSLGAGAVGYGGATGAPGRSAVGTSGNSSHAAMAGGEGSASQARAGGTSWLVGYAVLAVLILARLYTV